MHSREHRVRPGVRPGVIFSAAVLSIALIGWCDYITGPKLSFSLFYLLPIVACGWWTTERLAVVTAGWAAIVWLLADVPFRMSEVLALPLWNAGTRVAIFVGVGFLTARVRRNTSELQVLNARLADLLAQESALARTDPLTGLANGRAFREALGRGLARSQRNGEPMCVVYIDIDNFKRVNDAFGHAAGDQVLGRIAALLRETLRGGDVPARLGGDEFAAACWDVEREVAISIAKRLVEQISGVGGDYPGTDLGASAGVAHFEHATESTDAILAAADAAMYEAKARGKNTVVVR